MVGCDDGCPVGTVFGGRITVVVPAKVTVPTDNARPSMLVRSSKIIFPYDRIVPIKEDDAPIVVDPAATQKTFSDLALFTKMTEALEPVVMVPEDWNNHVADESPLAFRVSVLRLFMKREPLDEQ